MTRAKNHDLVRISGEVRGGSELAWRFYDGSEYVWLPRSQVEWHEDEGEMEMPEWLAVEKGLV